VIRFLPSVPDYIYAQKEDTLFTNLYMSNQARIKINDSNISLEQITKYPWDGNIKIQINTNETTPFVLSLRIPGWARSNPLPGDLYRYQPQQTAAYSIRVNGKEISTDIHKGYAAIDRDWSDGDTLELVLPMAVQRVLANQHVKEDSGKVALERGPIVFCAEGIDNNGKALDLVIPDGAVFKTEFMDDLLNGIMTINGNVARTDGTLAELMAIPYYAWSHRGPGEMTVWFQRN
jgi:uncharacterized protein